MPDSDRNAGHVVSIAANRAFIASADLCGSVWLPLAPVAGHGQDSRFLHFISRGAGSQLGEDLDSLRDLWGVIHARQRHAIIRRGF
jgi:hypothetical protein